MSEGSLPYLARQASMDGRAGSSGKKLTPTHLPSIAGAGRLAHLSSLQVELKEMHKFLHLPPSTIRRVSPTLNVLHLQLANKEPRFPKRRALSLPKAFSVTKGWNPEVATSNARPLSAHSPGPNEPFFPSLPPFH